MFQMLTADVGSAKCHFLLALTNRTALAIENINLKIMRETSQKLFLFFSFHCSERAAVNRQISIAHIACKLGAQDVE